MSSIVGEYTDSLGRFHHTVGESNNAGVIDVNSNVKALEKTLERFTNEGFKPFIHKPAPKLSSSGQYESDLSVVLEQHDGENLRWENGYSGGKSMPGYFLVDVPNTDLKGPEEKHPIQYPQAGAFISPFVLWKFLRNNSTDTARNLFAKLPDLYGKIADLIEEKILEPIATDFSKAPVDKRKVFNDGLTACLNTVTGVKPQVKSESKNLGHMLASVA